MYFPAAKSVFGKTTSCVKAVDDVSFEVEKGKTFGLVGESGCGKTTTGKCILRINTPTEGHIYYKGMDLSRASKDEIKSIRREIQLIFQDPYGSLDPRQSAYSIIKEAVVTGREKYTEAAVAARVKELLETVELLPEMGDRYPHEMSGGQRQRLGIARALACNPELIVCDEPVSALDVSIQAQILNLLQELQSTMGLTYLFISHDLSVVRHISNRILVMYLGQMVEICDSRELFRNPVHPYTKALLSAVPIAKYGYKRERILLEGDVPSPINPKPGCKFANRCLMAQDICRREEPPVYNVSPGHQVCCHMAEH